MKKFLRLAISFMFLISLSACDKVTSKINLHTQEINVSDRVTETQDKNSLENNVESFEKSLSESEKLGDTYNEYSFPENYIKQIENVSFNTTLVVPDLSEMQTIGINKGNFQSVDENLSFEMLFKNIEIIQSYKDSPENTEAGSYWYAGMDDAYLSAGGGHFSYSSGSYIQHVRQAFRMFEGYDDYNAHLYSTSNALNFSTPEAALDKADSLLTSLGIDLLNYSYTYYALDHATMQNEEYAMDMNGNEDFSAKKEVWLPEDDCYYFFIRQKVNDLQVYNPLAEIFYSPTDENAPIQMIVSSRGVELIQIDKVYEFSLEQEKCDLLPFEDISMKVYEKYGSILTSSEYEITKAELFMFALANSDESYRFEPGWILNVNEHFMSENGTQEMGNSYIFINAITGDEEFL